MTWYKCSNLFSGSLATIRDIAEISNGDIPDII